MMHYWQSSYGMLHSWQKNATNEQKNVMCYPQNCVIHTLPPLLFILQQNTLNHHPLNDKQNLESNFLEAPQSKVWWVAQKKWTLLSSTCTKEKWVCTPQNIHIPRSEVSLSSVFCCNAFSLHYYASESENRIACYPICPTMGRKLLYYSPPTSFCSVLFGERKNKISMTKIEFPFRYTCFSFSSASQTHFYFSHFKTQKTMLLTTIKCLENGQKCLICSMLHLNNKFFKNG